MVGISLTKKSERYGDGDDIHDQGKPKRRGADVVECDEEVKGGKVGEECKGSKVVVWTLWSIIFLLS